MALFPAPPPGCPHRSPDSSHLLWVHWYIVVAYALLFDRKSLYIDYSLLFTLICFFIISENMKGILTVRLEHSDHIFLSSALASQIISNVPSALLFAKFTTHWQGPALGD